jgi:hypothetical protein
LKKILFLPAFLAGLFVLVTVLYAGNEVKKSDQAMEKKCVEIMKDKRMMDMMMDHIAADDTLRMGMMGKMLVNAKDRKDRMQEMSGVMMGDEGMKGATMDDIALDSSMRQEMMEKIMKEAKGHPDEIKSMGQMIREDEKHSQEDDKNAEGMQGEGKDAPVRMMNDQNGEKDLSGK